MAQPRPNKDNSHPFEADFTAIFGDPIPFQDPVMHTDELKSHKSEGGHSFEDVFTAVIGDPIPVRDPNVHSDRDLEAQINTGEQTSSSVKCCVASTCAASIICLPYLCAVQRLVEQDAYGFSDNNGKTEIWLPGRHLILSPLNSWTKTHQKLETVIREGPVTIVRVKQGELGFGDDNAHPVVLLPGLHAYNDGKWTFDKIVNQNEELIQHGPIKFLTVKSGQVRICYIRGAVHLYGAGRYAINDPTFTVGDSINLFERDVIVKGPVSVVRVKLGEFGFADNNAHPVVLLPGLHVYNDSKWRFSHFAKQNDPIVEHGPIKFFTVKTGTVQACFIKGKVRIFEEGRYAVNDINFLLGDVIDMRQQAVVFDKHPVLLLGGVKMLVEGLLTFQVEDALKVVNKLGYSSLLPSVQNISKAELSRVFATLHIEDVSSQRGDQDDPAAAGGMSEPSVLGVAGALAHSGEKAKPKQQQQQQQQQQQDQNGPDSRSLICLHVVEHISPIVAEWGIKILNFQLESIKMADEEYSREYEEASLATAKAKANLRAAKAQNDITLSQAAARSRAAQIEAEGAKAAVIINAQAEAEARKIEADSRNAAADAMSNQFGQQLALAQQQVEFARVLKASVLTVSSDSAVGKALAANFKP